MKVFISWSGQRSKKVAEALRDWIPDVIQAVETWMSASDIEAGTRWAEELSRELNRIRFGIICLTRENLAAPWVLFEAGALSTGLNKARVCPYLFGIKPANITGPLAQFQVILAQKEDTRKLLIAINKALDKNALTDQRLGKYFDDKWPELDRTLKALR